MRATSRFNTALAIVAAASAVFSGGSFASARSGAAPVPPTSSHAQVIAQGVVTFTAGEHHWRLVTNDVGIAPLTIDAESPTFLVAASRTADAGAVRINEPDGLGWLLASGEATFRPVGSTSSIEQTPGALVREIAVDVGPGDDAFDPGDGRRDLDLVSDVLSTGESITVRSEVSALIYVTAGIATADDGSEVPGGSTRAIVGETTLTNDGDAPVVVLAAIIGSPVDVAPVTTEPAGDGPEPTQAPTTPAPTSPPTTIDPTLETDGDGLTDVEEIEIYGTNPNTYDTDGDTVSDYLEAKDGYSDPFNPDTDGDGFDDSEQFDGYDPLDATSFPGAPSATDPPAPPTSGP